MEATAPTAVHSVVPPRDDDQITNALTRAGIPPRYLGARFDNWRRSPATDGALRAAKRVATNPANLILIGPWGTGKTRLTASILAERAGRWLDAYPHEVLTFSVDALITRPPFLSKFTGVPQLLDAIRRSYEYEDEPDPLKPLLTAPLLVLDDLGREKATDWVLERLYVLIDTRYVNNLPTIATTNYPLTKLSEQYGAMVSRLSEDAIVANINATDQRGTR